MKTRMYLKRLVAAALVFCMALGLMPSGQMATSPAPIGGLNQVSFSGGNTIITPGVPNLTRMTLGAKMETSVTAQTASGQPLESRLFKVAYRSDNPKLVTVDAKGVLRALGSVPGMTTVHATVTYAKVSKTADLIVSVSGQNLLKDGSFEQNRTLSNVWRSAREEKYGGSANVVSGDAHSGKSAYQVVLSPAQKNQATQLSLADKRLVPVKSGKFYELSAWIKVSAFADGKDSTAASVKNKAWIEVAYCSTNTTSSMPISDSTRRYEIVGNVADWTFVRIPVYAPRTANAKFANIRICAGTGTSDTLGIGGKFLFDELSFHEISVTDVKLTLPDDSGLISVGSSVAASTEIMMSNNDLLVPAASDAVTYTSSSPSAISVSDKGIVTAKKPGNAELKVSVNLNGKTFSVSKKMRALNDILNAAYAFGDVRGITVGQTKAIRPSGRMQSGKSAPLSNAKITYKSANPKVASVSAAGVVKALAKGSSDVSVSVTLDGVTRSTVVPVVVGDCKTESTIFTKSKVAAARKNVKQYDWAKAELKTATDFADKIADNPEFLWNAVPSQKLPRGITVGFIYDPAAWTCAYCGVDLRAKHGSYPYYMDPINKPWKIKCPDCNRWFPSNDFESYYKSGLNEQGEFVPALADKKFLVNELYPEKGTGWGVDDGYGYVTGKIQPNGVREVKTFIAYYIHWGLWQKTADKSENTALIGTGLNALKDAYLYTGDARYGRAGAILIDRIADLYPDFKLEPYRDFYNSHGLGYEGKVVGRIWETDLATELAQCYDAFYPAMDDAKVVSFLSDKAKTHALVNPKTSASMIRENCENGILRNIYDEVQDANIFGNFGMHQTSLATAAVALDTMPHTKDMIDFTFKAGEYLYWLKDTKCSGGNVLAQLVDKVDRDGHGNEAGPGYNVLWLNQMVKIADAMDGYTGYATADLYKNPKFVKMFSAMYRLYLCGTYTAQIGDSGGTANPGLVGSLANATLGFIKTGDPKLAQVAYLLNKNTVKGLHASIFTENPEKIASDIEAVIKKNGVLNLGSDMLPGYGFAALRDGKLSGDNNTQRDFWMYFGRTNGHGHLDAGNIGIHAFGLDMAPDFGYPEATGVTDNRMQWVRNTISHNTVVVNSRGQDEKYDGNPLHFDDSGDVKVMDVAFNAYEEASIYRRSVVMVKVNDDVSYAVDFFHVKGGNDHIYTFHAQSDEIAETEGLNLVAQATGTYAGTGVPWGPGAATGFSWLRGVSRAEKPGAYSVDFKIKDFRKVLPTEQNLHLRMTMLGSAALSDVAIADGTPPRVKGNIESQLKQVLAHRAGTNLDTMFTTVYEPYKDTRYIKSIDEVKTKIINGAPGKDDVVSALKITLTNGKVEYVVHASNNKITYRVDDKFDFRGAFGVYRDKNSYLNDGDILGDYKKGIAALTGKVVDFTKELSMENSITVAFDGKVDVKSLANKFILVENDGVQNGAYQIKSAKAQKGNHVVLDLGSSTVIRKYIDSADLSKGYIYNIGKGQSFKIPLGGIVADK